MLLDKSIMELHQNGFFVVGDLMNVEVIDDEITLESFKNKVDYLDSGYNVNGDKKDILEICAIGICAYNHFQTFYTNREFINYLMENLDVFLENGNIPKDVAKYYKSVLVDGNIDYMNNYFVKDTSSSKGNNNVRVYAKSTAVGKALADKNAAYVNVLLIPSILVLMYFVIAIIYLFLK